MNLNKIPKEAVGNALSTANNMTELLRTLGFARNRENITILGEYIVANKLEYPVFFGMRKHMSIIAIAPKKQLQSIVDGSSSNSDILRFFGLRMAGSNASTLKKILQYHNIDMTILNKNKEIARNIRIADMVTRRNASITYDDVKNCNFSTIRKFIIKNKLIAYKCQVPECGNEGFRFGKPLILELDHIDGDRFNNALNNLRFLCPCCHSQTETFAGKARHEKIIKRCECGKLLSKDNISGNCSQCASKARVVKLKFNVSKGELEALLIAHSMLKIGEMFGVSDNAIRKRCKKLEIDFKAISKYSHK